eukprot:CAMPEP_0114291972 /NCGR_PEP_ID=MMETSP0059-20121206/8799_1 /TAXON_ID=36894 /ORGANISM="Pyramimonas parkeae, Strain CCMP726" /LENGTH=220 /DNA_ID=CAMNT_0001413561 /DNA_START=1247 /DNA_END=1910 /DNA_ORIENTATION=+
MTCMPPAGGMGCWRVGSVSSTAPTPSAPEPQLARKLARLSKRQQLASHPPNVVPEPVGPRQPPVLRVHVVWLVRNVGGSMLAAPLHPLYATLEAKGSHVLSRLLKRHEVAHSSGSAVNAYPVGQGHPSVPSVHSSCVKRYVGGSVRFAPLYPLLRGPEALGSHICACLFKRQEAGIQTLLLASCRFLAAPGGFLGLNILYRDQGARIFIALCNWWHRIRA